MQRRSFIRKSSISGLAISMVPGSIWTQDTDYTITELMGKEKIDLFGKGINLRKEAHAAFVDMQEAAQADGIVIKIVSSYRSFTKQASIFEKKYHLYTDDEGMEPMDAIDKIIEYSTIPGTSRHHWGTDIDIIDGNHKTKGDVLVPGKFTSGGPFEDLKKWMDAHSEECGFYLVYTNDPNRKGFKYEPWHYSYAPLSVPMLTTFRRKNILQLLEKEEFAGSEHFTTGFVNSYIRDNILDINPKLL
jgi:LAS superfamily LD-carboxypeptidase LdcB